MNEWTDYTLADNHSLHREHGRPVLDDATRAKVHELIERANRSILTIEAETAKLLAYLREIGANGVH